MCCFFFFFQFGFVSGCSRCSHIACVLRSEAYLGRPSATGTIARSSKRSAAVMWVEGALLLPADVVFGHGPIPAQTTLLRHSWWAGGLSVCLSEPPPPTLHPNPRPPAAPPHPSHHLQLTLTGRHAAQLSYRKWGKKKIKNCWSILWRHHAIIASSLRTIRTHTHTKECMQAKRGLQHTKGMTPTTSSRSLCGGETVCFHVNHQY